MRTNPCLCLFLSLTALSLPGLAQFCHLPEKPQVGQVISFTYTPPATALLSDSIIEGRYVRYGSPTMMHISRPSTVKLIRQGRDYVGQFPASQKDVTGTMLLVKNPQSPQKIDLYAIPIYDTSGQPVPHAIGGQASVGTRTHFLYDAGSRPDPNRVVALYEQELKQHPDLQPLYWSDYLAALIKQKKPGYGPKVKAGIESYLASRPTPAAAEVAAGAQLYESMGDFPKANALRERQKTIDPAGSLAQKDRSMRVRNENRLDQKKSSLSGLSKRIPQLGLPACSDGSDDGWVFQEQRHQGLLAFIEPQSVTQLDPLMLSTMANLLAEERRSLPEAEQLVKRAMLVLKTQPRPRDVAGNWETEKPIRQRQLMTIYARILDQQGKTCRCLCSLSGGYES